MEGLEVACKGHAVTWPLETPKNIPDQSVNFCDFGRLYGGYAGMKCDLAKPQNSPEVP